jgi:hypothetical protein
VSIGNSDILHTEIGANRYRFQLGNWADWGFIEVDTEEDHGDAMNPQIVLAPDYTGVALWSKAIGIDNDDRFGIQTSFFR